MMSNYRKLKMCCGNIKNPFQLWIRDINDNWKLHNSYSVYRTANEAGIKIVGEKYIFHMIIDMKDIIENVAT